MCYSLKLLLVLTPMMKDVFSLYSEKKQKELEVSFIGYTTKKIHLEKDNTKGLVVVLVEGEQLDAVTIVAKPKRHFLKKRTLPIPFCKEFGKTKRNADCKMQQLISIKNTLLPS